MPERTAIHAGRHLSRRRRACLVVPSADLAKSGDCSGMVPFMLGEQVMSADLTLFEKLGGEPGVASLVVAFYEKVMADPELAPFFQSSAIQKLHTMQSEFFTMALGGPAQYSGRPLAHVHHGRGITSRHFGRFVGHLLATLEERGVEAAETREVITRINGYANEITGVSY